MKQTRFHDWMSAVDDELLEAAQRPVRKKGTVRPWIALAACLCLVCGGVMYSMQQPAQRPDTSSVMLPNPIRSVALEEITALGYAMPLPAAVEAVEYTIIDQGQGIPMAQAQFLQDGNAICYRALKTEEPTDISGMYYEWTDSLDWNVGEIRLQMRESADGNAWVGWYAPEEGTQWCISGSVDDLVLLHSAQSILDILGYDLTVAPVGAEAVEYNAFVLDDLTVGETRFVLDGVQYAFRMAATLAVESDFADISGEQYIYEENETAMVGWCDARLSFDEGGAGRIVWFDAAPGLLYSLTMDDGASAKAMIDAAGLLFTPAQDNVG